MQQCKVCGSYAINPQMHGRDKTDLDLCDVCYWRKRADQYDSLVIELIELAKNGDHTAQDLLESTGVDWT